MDATRGGEVTADLRAARVNAVGAGGARLLLHNSRYELEGGQDETAKPCVRTYAWACVRSFAAAEVGAPFPRTPSPGTPAAP